MAKRSIELPTKEVFNFVHEDWTIYMYLYTSAFIFISSAHIPYRYTQVDIRQLINGNLCILGARVAVSQVFCSTIHTYIYIPLGKMSASI